MKLTLFLVRDIIEQVQSSLNMELQPQNVQFLTDIDRYGTYLVKVEDYYSDKFDRKFSFRLKVNVKREFAKGEKSEIEFNQDEFREVDEKKKKKKKK